MTSILLELTGAKAVATTTGLLTEGMVGVPVTIVCDSAWDGLVKTLVCKSGAGKRVILNVGDTATIAPEVLRCWEYGPGRLILGVEGRRLDGTLVIPSIWADAGEILPGAESEGEASVAPENPVWANILNMIGSLEQLKTHDRGNIVAAINEAVLSSGSTMNSASPRNLLDNSDFRNPVNQRGITSSTANAEYVIDRWFIGDIWTVGACGFSQYDGSIAFTQGLFQRMTVSKDQIAGKTYTLVLKKSDETMLVFPITLPTEIVSGKDHPCVCNNVTGVLRYWDGIGLEVRFETAKAISCVWAALYEGEYREETIPEYRPKGYGAELLECQRYYQICSTNGVSAVDMRPTMRLSSPTVTAVNGGYAYCADL